MSHHYELHMTRVLAFLGFGGWEHVELEGFLALPTKARILCLDSL
jgi:hypothetical protein